MREELKFDTFEELFAIEWDDTPRTPEDRAADWYAEIDFEEIQDGKVVHKNVLYDLLEPFRETLIDALGIAPTTAQSVAIYQSLSRAFGSGCITTKRQDNRHLHAKTKDRSRDSIAKIDLLYSEWERLDQPAYKELAEHMQQEHGITFKVSTIGHYIRRRLKQQDEK